MDIIDVFWSNVHRIRKEKRISYKELLGGKPARSNVTLETIIEIADKLEVAPKQLFETNRALITGEPLDFLPYFHKEIERKVLLLRYQDQHTLSQIANELHYVPQTIKSTHNHVCDKIRFAKEVSK